MVYSATLETFPGLYMFMSFGSLLTAGLLNIYLYTQRHRMIIRDDQGEEHEMS